MAGIARTAVYTLAFAILAPYVYDRYQGLSGVVANRPGHLKPIYNITSHEINFRDRIRNCEDVLLDEGLGVAILSCDPGRDKWNTVMGTFHADETLSNGKLWLYDYTKPDLDQEKVIQPLKFKNFPNENDFHPLGVELDVETSTLYAVSHAQAGSCIEVFQLEINAATLTHVRTIRHPLLHAPNSIHSLENGRLYVTNDHMFVVRKYGLLSKVETFSGLPGGTVVYIDINSPESAKVVARVPFANGITMLNSTTLAVASTSKPGVYFYEVQPNNDLKFKSWFRVPAAIDNLSVDSSGVLLMSGHPSAFELMKVSKNRPNCRPGSEVEAEREACECTAPSWAAQWTEKDGIKTLFKGNDFCSSTMLVRDVKRRVAMVSGLYEKGVMIIRE